MTALYYHIVKFLKKNRRKAWIVHVSRAVEALLKYAEAICPQPGELQNDH